MCYVGGGVGHQDVMETQVDDPDDEGNEMDIEVDPQDVSSDSDGEAHSSDSEGELSNEESSHGDLSNNEDVKEWDPDGDDIGLDVDDDFGDF